MLDVTAQYISLMFEAFPSLVITRGARGGLYYQVGELSYDASAFSVQEGLIRAYIFFEAHNLAKQLPQSAKP